MYVLGINEGHTASAALIHNGRLLAAASEERFTRVKGQAGFPKQAVAWCLNEAGRHIADVEIVAMGAKYPAAAVWYRTGKTPVNRVLRKFERFLFIAYPLYRVFRPLLARIHRQQTANRLGVSVNKVRFLDHHTAHAWAALGIFGRAKQQLIITNDGAGDGTCGKVFVASGRKLREIAATPNRYSLAYLYYYVTKFLGFTPDQDEYKVMGLAGYADRERVNAIYPIFQRMFRINGLAFQSTIDRISYYPYLKNRLTGRRFDDIAGAVQRFTEDLIVRQVRAAIRKTHISRVLFGGGLYMNVKANMQITKVAGVRNVFVCPSPGDESVAIGAASWAAKLPKPVDNLYLGPSYSEKEIEEKLIGMRDLRMQKLTDKNIPKTISALLARGQVVARFAGRMEFGARALGNRSILADPRNPAVVRVINEQIKNRDFWMPFAPTVLAESAHKYLINPKRIDSPFMMIAYETTSRARKDLVAAIHPHDFTCRPHILTREQNPEYYDTIKAFERITGVGAVLNTSFNLHGEPIVCSPEDAIRTFLASGLRYLLLDHVLVMKNEVP